MKSVFEKIRLAAIIIILPIAAFSQTNESAEKTRRMVSGIIEKSFPELKKTKVEIKIFQSGTNYFKSQFSFPSFLTFRKLRCIIFVNPEVFNRRAPEDAISAILAHELAHVLYYKNKNRFELLGLISLTDKNFTAKFERRADLEAIARGYGEGLKSYRKWLYENIPPQAVEAKKRDYFSPEEIDLIMQILREKPEKINVWRKRVPRNSEEIKAT